MIIPVYVKTDNLVKFVKENLDKKENAGTFAYYSIGPGSGYKILSYLLKKYNILGELVISSREPVSRFGMKTFKTTLLHTAINRGDLKLTKFLLNKGSSPNQLQPNNKTALSVAVRDNTYDMVKLLLKYGANVNKKSGIHGNTPIIEAILHSDLNIIKLLVRNGAIVNSKALKAANERVDYIQEGSSSGSGGTELDDAQKIRTYIAKLVVSRNICNRHRANNRSCAVKNLNCQQAFKGKRAPLRLFRNLHLVLQETDSGTPPVNFYNY